MSAVALDLVVIVVSYNSADDIPGFVESLRSAAEGLSYRLLIIDNDSQDGSVEAARGMAVESIPAGGNVGYAAAINVARRIGVDSGAMLIANPDTRFYPDTIRQILDASSTHASVTVPRIVDEQGRTRLSLRREPTLGRQLGEALLGDHVPKRGPRWSIMVRDAEEYEVAHSVDWATGAVLMIPRECDRLVGEWQEDYFLYSEEVDFCSRARAAGFNIEYLPSAATYHEEGGSGRSPALVSLDAVNRLRYFRGRHSAMHTLVYGAAILLESILRSGDRAQRQAARETVRTMVRNVVPGTFPDGRDVVTRLDRSSGV